MASARLEFGLLSVAGLRLKPRAFVQVAAQIGGADGGGHQAGGGGCQVAIGRGETARSARQQDAGAHRVRSDHQRHGQGAAVVFLRAGEGDPASIAGDIGDERRLPVFDHPARQAVAQVCGQRTDDRLGVSAGGVGSPLQQAVRSRGDKLDGGPLGAGGQSQSGK